jgi:HEAT repeat protein
MIEFEHDPLPLEIAVPLTAFARACKGAARAVALYPPEHRAVADALERLAFAARTATEPGPLAILVVPDNLVVGGRALERPDMAVADTAALLHGHGVGEITIQRDVDLSAWKVLVALLGRDPEDVRVHGGLARALTTAGAIGISVTEIDYSSLFDATSSDSKATWDSVVLRCLERDALDLDEETLRLLCEIASDPARLAEFFERFGDQAGHQSPEQVSLALLRTLGEVAAYLGRQDAELADRALDNMASAFSRLTPELVMQIVHVGNTAESAHAPLVADLLRRITDQTLAQLVARSVARDRAASARLAEAVRTLAPDPRRREAIAALTRDELARTQIGEESNFEALWAEAADILTSCTDTAYVPDAYDRELTSARRRAGELARSIDDPPERIIGWLKTVSDVSVRGLDLRLLTDLLAVQQHPERRRDVVDLVMFQVGELADLGDFDAARHLVGSALAHRESSTSVDVGATVTGAIEQLASGPFMSRLAAHLQVARDDEFESVRALCAAVGPGLVPRVAELLSAEGRPRTRKRLADLLIGFGEHGRHSVAQLRASRNPAVRRTAVHLLRLGGGPESVPDLAALVADPDATVQRDAARALIGLALDEAFVALRDILCTPNHPGRQTMVDELGTTRDRRAAQLLCHLVRHLECRGELKNVYLESIARLGVLGGPDAVDALAHVLNRGEWWAPFRTREIRTAAAAALAQIPLPSADEALQQAAANGSFGVRAVARRHLGTR